MQVQVEAILHGRAIDLGDQPAGPGQCGAVEADPLANRDQLLRGLPRMLAAAAATWMPSSFASGASPRFSAPMTLVVMPDECQSMPITAPND